jgi:acetyl-CoA carboxylase carboxyltransferase component
VPLVGIASGRCFAGNAVLLGCCDVVIATENATIGMGGPAMIEGGGLGIYKPEEVGPIDVQTRSGVVDIAVPDEASRSARGASSTCPTSRGRSPTGPAPTSACCAGSFPRTGARVYDVRQVLETAGRHRLGAGAAAEVRPGR